MAASAFTFEHWPVGVVAAMLLLATLAVGAARPPAVPRATLVLATAGALLLTLAAGGLAFLRPASRPVAVLVDRSASTRGAAYRDDASLRQRIRELLGDTPYEVRNFGEELATRTV